MWQISQAQVDTVLGVTTVAIPVLALAYLATDRERFLLGRGVGGYLPEIVKPDTRFRDSEGEIKDKSKEEQEAEAKKELKDMAYQLATERLDAVFGIVFVVITGLTFSLSLLGLVLRPTPTWLFSVATCGTFLNLDIILLGVTSQLTAEIERKTPPKDSKYWVKPGPSRGFARLSDVFGILILTIYGFLAPIGTVVTAILLSVNLVVHK